MEHWTLNVLLRYAYSQVTVRCESSAPLRGHVLMFTYYVIHKLCDITCYIRCIGSNLKTFVGPEQIIVIVIRGVDSTLFLQQVYS